MAIAVQDVQTATDTGGSVTVTKPTGLAENDLMVACVASLNVSGHAVNLKSGWTNIGSRTISGNPDYRMMYKIADSSDVAASDFTFDGAGTDPFAATLYRIDGHSLTLVAHDTINGTGTADGSTATVSGNIDALVPDGLLIFMTLIHNEEGAFSNYSVTGGSNPTWTERQDVGNPSAVDQRFAVADGTYDNNTDITAASVDIASTNVTGIILAFFPPAVGANGTAALLDNDNDTFFAPAGSAGVTGTAALLENNNETIFSPSGAANNPVWTNKTKGSTSWTNKTK